MAEVRTVAILLFDGVNSLDVAGPAEAFAFVRHADGTPVYRILTWGMGEGVVRSESGLRLAADGPAPDGATGDLLIIPGGPGAREPETLRAIAAWLRANQSGFLRVASVCTGAYPLAESGLMDGRTITTHWAYAAGLRQRYPRVKVRSDLLFSRDGKFYSSGGVTAGIDLALELIEADCGARAAMDTARELVVFLRRTGSQAQFSEPLKMQAQTGGDLAEVCLWAANNLGGDLSVETLADRANLSPRHFARRFKDAFGTSPAQHILALRLDSARTALAQDRASIDQVAHLSGFQSANGFRRAFERQFRLSPSEYQKRFSQRGAAA